MVQLSGCHSQLLELRVKKIKDVVMRAKIKIDKITYPKNCAPAGPISTSLLANPSPSTMGGGLASLCLFTKRQVIRVGAVHLRGGMMILIPWCRLPLMEPPLASTIKLTRNLQGEDERPNQAQKLTIFRVGFEIKC